MKTQCIGQDYEELFKTWKPGRIDTGRIVPPPRSPHPNPQNLWIHYVIGKGELSGGLRLLTSCPGNGEITLNYVGVLDVIIKVLIREEVRWRRKQRCWRCDAVGFIMKQVTVLAFFCFWPLYILTLYPSPIAILLMVKY